MKNLKQKVSSPTKIVRTEIQKFSRGCKTYFGYNSYDDLEGKYRSERIYEKRSDAIKFGKAFAKGQTKYLKLLSAFNKF